MHEQQQSLKQKLFTTPKAFSNQEVTHTNHQDRQHNQHPHSDFNVRNHHGHTQTPSKENNETPQPLVVNRPRTSSPVHQQNDQRVDYNNQSRDQINFASIKSHNPSQMTPSLTLYQQQQQHTQQQQQRHQQQHQVLQQQQDPMSLLYQDLDDEGPSLTTIASMETSCISEKSGKDVQLTHFIETVNIFLSSA